MKIQMSNIYSIQALSKRFPKRKPLFENFNLEINKGDFILVRGRSGSGKTTLLNFFLGFETWDSGSISFMGRDLSAIFSDSLEKQSYFNNIGFVSQFNILLPELNVIENLMVPLFNIDWEERTEIAFNMLKQLQLDEKSTSSLYQLSGGELRRLNIGVALIGKPKILILDEPTSNLNTKLANKIFSLITSVGTKFADATLMVTHDRTLSTPNSKEINLSS
jgi:ABC-type lipoprotein export system ATPase subunit